VIKKGAVRRSKLYYLRGKKGKAAKVREKIGAAGPTNRTQTPVEERNVPESENLTSDSVPEVAIESTSAIKK